MLGCRKITATLTPCSRVLLEKLTGFWLVKNFPSFYGTRRFITAFTRASHLSLSWVSSIQSILPHPTSWRSILIFSSHLRLGLSSGLLPSGFPCNPVHAPPPYTPHALPVSFFSILSPAQYWVRSTDPGAPHYVVYYSHTCRRNAGRFYGQGCPQEGVYCPYYGAW
jgi:hypothetical protein